jgi:hypothetical protein
MIRLYLLYLPHLPVPENEDINKSAEILASAPVIVSKRNGIAHRSLKKSWQ